MHVDESHRHNAEQKKPSDSMYMKVKNRTMNHGARRQIVVIFEGVITRVVWGWNGLYLDLGGGYVGVCTCKNSTSYNFKICPHTAYKLYYNKEEIKNTWPSFQQIGN